MCLPAAEVQRHLPARPIFSGEPPQNVPERPPFIRRRERHQNPREAQLQPEGRRNAIDHLRGGDAGEVPRGGLLRRRRLPQPPAAPHLRGAALRLHYSPGLSGGDDRRK